jgi:hypothetical protein
MKDIRSIIKEVLDLLAQKDEPSWDKTLYVLKQKDYHNALGKYCEECDNFSPVTELG